MTARIACGGRWASRHSSGCACCRDREATRPRSARPLRSRPLSRARSLPFLPSSSPPHLRLRLWTACGCLAVLGSACSVSGPRMRHLITISPAHGSPFGGLFISGGIAAKNPDWVQSEAFLSAYADKGRMSGLVMKVRRSHGVASACHRPSICGVCDLTI